jgi:hypothetical protein
LGAEMVAASDQAMEVRESGQDISGRELTV